jgi:hypothetical protein
MAVPRHGPGQPRKQPERVIDAQACEAAPRRKRLAKRGMALMGPPRRHRVKPPWPAGRQRRRDRRRWNVERTFAWVGHFRRRLVR